MRSVVKQILAPDGTRKVEVFRRDDGTYGYEESYYSDDPREQIWCPCGPRIECFVEDAVAAEREARGRVLWLGERGDDSPPTPQDAP